MLGTADPAEGVPTVVSYRHLFLVLIELVEHGLGTVGSERACAQGLSGDCRGSHHELTGHAENATVIHVVLVLTVSVGLTGRHAYYFIFVGDVTCVTGELLLR